MKYSLVPLSELSSEEIARLAELHCRVMETLLRELGAAMVQHYYEAAKTDADSLGWIAKSPDGEILGWAMGSANPALLNRKLRQPAVFFVWQILTHPRAIGGLLRTMLSSSPANKLKTGEVELTYIGLAESARGKGLGQVLLLAFAKSARQAGYTRLALSVESDNLVAQRLYTRSGFQVKTSFREGRFERLRMQVELDALGKSAKSSPKNGSSAAIK